MLLSVCLTFALSADTQTVDINVSAPVDTEQQFRINFLEYLPKETELSSGELLSYDSSIVSGYTVPILQQNGYMKFSTRAFEEPVSTTLVVELTTTTGDTIICNINVRLTGQYIVNITAEPQNVLYDGNPHPGYINLSGKLTDGSDFNGDYDITYKKDTGEILPSLPVEVGTYEVTIAPKNTAKYKGQLTFSFSIIEEADARYQTAPGQSWQPGSFAEAVENSYDGGTIYLINDVELTSTVSLEKSLTITSDGAAKSISTTKDKHGYLLQISDAVELNNVIVDGGSEQGLTASRGLIAINGGSLTLGDGAVVRNNNNTTKNGASGGVCLIDGKLYIQEGAQISNNTAQLGGGVYIVSGSVVMSGGEISDNTATTYGGGVYVDNSDSFFTLESGTISNNKAIKVGGGIFVNIDGTLELHGGSVADNNAVIHAGGIYCSPFGNIIISGNPIVTGNTSDKETDGGLYPDGNHNYGYSNIEIAGLTSGAALNFYTWLECDNLLLATGYNGYTITAQDLAALRYMSDTYVLRIDQGKVVLSDVTDETPFSVTVDGIVTEHYEGTAVRLTAEEYDDKEFSQWQGLEQLIADGYLTEADKYKPEIVFIMPEYPVDVTALYTPIDQEPDEPEPDDSDDDFIWLLPILNQTFDVTASATDGGTISPAGTTEVRYDGSVGYTLTPDDGYMLADIIVDSESRIDEVGADGSFTLERVREDHTIEAVFAPLPWENPYSDIDEESPYYDDVKFVTENGLMDGLPGGLFAPDLTLSRAMAVTILWRAEGCPVVNYLMQFDDVPEDEWYSEAVRWASAEGIVNGYDEVTFGPNNEVTREQLAAILYRYLQYHDGGFDGLWMFRLDYEDADDVSDWAYEPVCWLLMNDIYPSRDGQLCPSEPATRAETASMVHALVDIMAESNVSGGSEE
ncbi:MAG TPA: S-layer homology domain-containing protein [Firmicutes bacterium]|nr:S-layer homology domain-containing protein [Bacillota bacterium]